MFARNKKAIKYDRLYISFLDLWTFLFFALFHCKIPGLEQRVAGKCQAKLRTGGCHHRPSKSLPFPARLCYRVFWRACLIQLCPGIFLIFANFSRFHSALSKHQCGEVTMHILELLGRRYSNCKTSRKPLQPRKSGTCN